MPAHLAGTHCRRNFSFLLVDKQLCQAIAREHGSIMIDNNKKMNSSEPVYHLSTITNSCLVLQAVHMFDTRVLLRSCSKSEPL